MKRLLLWLVGVALGVVVLLAAVLGVSYSFTSEGAKPASEVQFAGQELEPNGELHLRHRLRARRGERRTHTQHCRKQDVYKRQDR